jgi:ABC-type glycerol-3-phosphate transport system substrate-binding protein
VIFCVTRAVRRGGAALLLGLALLLGGCAGFELPTLPDLTRPFLAPTAASTQPPLPSTPTASPTGQPAQTDAPPPTPVAGPPVLTVWLPPQFDPSADTPSGRLLRERLAAFVEANPGVQLQTRVKALDGAGGLLETLSTASAAAPDAMPSLIALPRSDLETAALKGLITPLDGISDLLEDDDWYPYARQLGQIQGSTFGIPFGGDALLMVYRPRQMGAAPTTWEALLGLGHPVAFTAADPQSMLTLDLYMMLGGVVEDDQRRPTLDQEVLVRALKLYTDGAKSGVFPYSLSQIQTDRQAWQAYEEQLGQWLITWSSLYLSTLPPESAAAVLPSLEEKSLSLATGWVWALSGSDSALHAESARLAEYLSDPAFLAQWDAALGLLPPRPSALAAWPNSSLKPVLEEVTRMAQVRPSNDVMAGLAPALEAATLQVMKRESDAVQAARTAAERLSIPKNK